MEKYNNYCKKQTYRPNNYLKLREICHFFQSNKVSVIKLNYSLTLKDAIQHDSYLIMHKDGETIDLYKKIPLAKMY